MVSSPDMSLTEAAPAVREGGAIPSMDAVDQLRAHTYRFLAALLAAPPGADLLGLLDEPEERGEEPGDGALAQAWQMLRLAARETEPERLDDEYHDLFIGLGRGELVPYASWYLTGFLMDRPLAYLRQDLRHLGIERQDQVSEPEDHAAALCEVMVEIIQAGAELPRQWQRKFFNDHLAPWLGLFFRDLQQARCACFYSAVGRLGEAFMTIEAQLLDVEIRT